jgi:hypothetical protein
VRQHIELTDEIRDTADEIRRDSNLVAGFLDECVEFDPDRRVSVPDFCASFSVWWLENKGEDRRMPSNEAIGKALMAMSEPRIAIHAKELRDDKRRYYAGIKLNEQGVGYHKRAWDAKAFEGKIASTTSADGQVNSVIPEGWATRPSVIAMRLRQAADSSGNPKDTTVILASTVMPQLSSVMELSADLSCDKTLSPLGKPRF